MADIIAKLDPGQEVTITRDEQPIATIRAVLPPPRKPRQPGTLRGTILYIAPDFDDIPEGFEEYIE